MEPFTNSAEWKDYRLKTEVTLQLDDTAQVGPSPNQKPEISSNDNNLSDFSDDDTDGKPKCNMWRGQNHDLFVLGYFENEFQKRIQTFQVPPTVPISLDPFCRSEFPNDDPPIANAYLIWKGKERRIIKKKVKASGNQSSDSLEISASRNFKTYDEESSTDDDGCFGEESDTDPEISQHIDVQRRKKVEGLNVTGETYWFDDDLDVIRNLHSTSISLTNYGTLADEKEFGNTRLLFDQLSSQEQLMLSPGKQVPAKTVENVKEKEVNLTLEGGGDY